MSFTESSTAVKIAIYIYSGHNISFLRPWVDMRPHAEGPREDTKPHCKAPKANKLESIMFHI